MAQFVSDLRVRLRSEQSYITNQKQLLGLLAKNVEAKLSNLYLTSWFLAYLKENHDKVKSRVIQPIDFVKIIQYKSSLLNTDIKLSTEITYNENPNIILSTLRQEPKIIALLFSHQERTDKMENLARIVYSTVFGSLLTAQDEFMFLKVMMELLCLEFKECKSYYDLFQKGSGFKSLFTVYLENSIEVKGYFLTVFQKQIHFLMDEELFLEFEENKAEMHATQGYPGEGEFCILGKSEEIKLKIRESAEFIGSLVTNLIRSLNQQLGLTPCTVRLLANLVKREISKKWTLPVDAIQSCLASLIFGSFIVPVIADPASFGLVEDSLLTDRIRSNLNCIATVLQNLPRMNWRRLSPDLKLVFNHINMDIYASYIDSLVLGKVCQSEYIDGSMSLEEFKSTACFFYKKIEAERASFLISRGDLIFLQSSIAKLDNIEATKEYSPILRRLKESEALVPSPIRNQDLQLPRKKKHSSQPNNPPSGVVLPKLMLFPIKEGDLDAQGGFEIKTEEEIVHGRKQVPSLREISKENTAIESALKESYCIEGNYLLTRSARTRQNSVSGYDTLRRQVDSVCHLSSVDDTSETSSSSGDEEDKSYEGDTSGIGSNSNSSSYKANSKVAPSTLTIAPPLPPYPSTKASISLEPISPTSPSKQLSDSDSLEHSGCSSEVSGVSSLARMQRSASLGDKDSWDKKEVNVDIYENAEFLRIPPHKKSSTLVPFPKRPVIVSDSLPISKNYVRSDKNVSADVTLRKGNKFRKNARNIIKSVSTFGHQKHNKRFDSLSLSKFGSQPDFSNNKDLSVPAKESQWSKLRTSTFTYMTMQSEQKTIPTSKYFTLLPLNSSVCSYETDINSVIKRLRLVLSTCSYPDLNIPEPDFRPVEIQQQVTELGAYNSLTASHQISMSPKVANKRSLLSLLNHEFNISVSRNDTTQIALTSDMLHIVDIMPEIQVEIVINGLEKEYFARKEYVRYLTQISLQLTAQQEQIEAYEKSVLSQVEELERLFMDTEVRSYLLQNNTLSQLDLNLSLTENKPLTIQKYVYVTLEQMGLDPVWHNWVHHDALLCSIERNVFNHIFYGLFFPNGIKDQEDNELFRIRLDLLSKKLKVDDEFLGIDRKYHFSAPWPGALQVLHTLNVYKTPRDKLDVITNCCKLITNLLHYTDPMGMLGADEILPVLIYVTVNSNPKYLFANSTFLEQYSDSIEKGESAYWFNQFFIAISNVSTLIKSYEIV